MLATAFLAAALLHVNAIAGDSFRDGTMAFETGDFQRAAKLFSESTASHPAPGTFQNLGNAEWQRGHTSGAILAWERALWLDPYDVNAKNNLKFARETAQLESPQLAWHEIASTWLPATAWAWIAAVSLWITGAALVLPGVLRWKKSSWHQAVAVLGLGIFILSIPANIGVITRTQMGFIMDMETPLLLTPTANAESVTKLSAGEPARVIRLRGNYLFIRTSHAEGWIERGQLERVCNQ